MADPKKKKKTPKGDKKELDKAIEQIKLKQWFASDKMHPSSDTGKKHTVLVATDETK